MASLNCLVVLLYFLDVMIIKVHAAAVTISSLDTITLPDQDLVINCKVGTSPAPSTVYVITLSRNNSNTNNAWIEIAKVNPAGVAFSSPGGSYLSNRGGATITGKITPANSAELVLKIEAGKVRCTDAASYQCKLNGDVPGDPSYVEGADKSVGIEVKPSSTSDIVVSPDSSPNKEMHTYVPGTQVTLTCTGMVGNPAKLHRWCQKGVKDITFTSLKSTDVVNQEYNLTYQSSSCSYRRVSQLKYNITNQDTEIQFMCEDDTNEGCGDGLFTKQVTLKNNVPDNYVSTTTKKSEMSTNKDDENEETSKTNNGQPNTISIVLISIAAVVLVLCCIYAAWNAVTRIRKNQDGSRENPIVLHNKPREEVQLGQRSVNADGNPCDYVHDEAPNNLRGCEDAKNTSNTYHSLGRPDEPNTYQALERDQDYEIPKNNM